MVIMMWYIGRHESISLSTEISQMTIMMWCNTCDERISLSMGISQMTIMMGFIGRPNRVHLTRTGNMSFPRTDEMSQSDKVMSWIPDDVHGSEIFKMEKLFAYFRQKQIRFATLTQFAKWRNQRKRFVLRVRPRQETYVWI